MVSSTITEDLIKRFDAAKSAPFLFVGSGLSRRYLGMTDWKGLLSQLAGLTRRPYHYYISKATGDSPFQVYPKAATLIAKEFHEIWWSEEKYASERAVFQELCGTYSFPLKLQCAKYVEERSTLAAVPDELKDELDLLRKARLSGVITTNWDSLLELLFPDYTVYVGQNQALFSQSYSIAEIFKIHGSYRDPDSLVLTEEDYSNFNDRNPYLAAKLLTTFLDHPVVFLGYSLSDDNIRRILKSVVDCLGHDRERVDFLCQRLVFVQFDPLATAPQMSEATTNVGPKDLRLTTIKASDFTPIYQSLAGTESRISAKILRQIKAHLYELVRTNDPTRKISVLNVDDLENHPEIEIVVGVGVQHPLAQRGTGQLSEIGYRQITVEELYRDVLFDGGGFDAEKLLSETIPELFKRNNRYVPVFKYLDACGALDDQRIPIRSMVSEEIYRYATQPRNYFQAKSHRRRSGTLKGLVNELGLRRALPYITHLDLDVDELQHFLSNNLEAILKSDSNSITYLKKLCCIYDRCRFGPGFLREERTKQFHLK